MATSTLLRYMRTPPTEDAYKANTSSLPNRLATTLARTWDLGFTAFGGPPAYPTLLVALRSYTLVNLSLRYRLSREIELFARGENLLDEDYQEVFAYRAAGRAFFGGVRARF